MWTDGRMISNESASRCPNHTTTKESAAYLIGKMDGEKTAIPVEKHRMLLHEMYEQGKFDGAMEAEEATNTADQSKDVTDTNVGCKWCEDEYARDNLVCYIPTDDGSSIDPPVRYCPSCGRRIFEEAEAALKERSGE
jgi:hypothetical protein